MIRPRWVKVLADLWGNKLRSLLVITSIAVGLFAFGIIATMYVVLTADMANGYAAVNPANIQLSIPSFDDELVDRIEKVEGVQQAEGFRRVTQRMEAGPGEWISLELKGLRNPDEMDINRLELEQGKWPPDDREIVIDRYKLPDTHARVGNRIRIELPDGKVRELKLVGVVHDQTIGMEGIGGGFFLAPVQGYITLDTLEWLGQPANYNRLSVVVEGDRTSADHIETVAARVRQEVEDSGYTIASSLQRSANDHPNTIYVQAIAGVLLLLGLLVVFLSAFLVTNTLSALLNQQMQQIGIMKTVGGRRMQISGIYMMLIFLFGVLAFAIAFPLAYQAAFRLLDYLAVEINFVLQGFRLVIPVLILQTLLALLVPQIAGFYPILHGSQVSVQEAISGFAQSGMPARKSRLAGWTSRLKMLSRPMQISLRNAFRRKGRVLLTMVTLTLGGAVFIATFNVQGSLESYIGRLSKYFLADVNLTFDRPYRISEIQSELSHVPQVAEVEGWASARGELVLAGDEIGESVSLLGPPTDSALIEPIMISGRWLLPGDQNAIVLNEGMLSRFPDLSPGDTLRLRVNGEDVDWVVVGFFQLAGKSSGYLGYTSYEYLSELIHLSKKAITYRVVAAQPGLTLDQQKELGRSLEDYLRGRGYRITEVEEGLSLQQTASEGISILTAFLLIMAVLTALVGSIGLAGTMSMNVLERTREIGVMRAIGATNSILFKLVISEGMIIGLVSWTLAVAASLPITKMMSDTITVSLFDAPSNFSYTPAGPFIWLGLVLVLSVLASVMPARSATRLTIREVLAYE